MAKAIFTIKEQADYDDLPWDRYHFPKTYLNQVRDTVGDLIIYYEPRRLSHEDSSRGGRQSYFAAAEVTEITEDSSRLDHFYAKIKNYFRFDNAVPFKEGDTYFESKLRREDGGTNKGAFGRSVRLIPEHEFETIIAHGFSDDVDDFGSNQENDVDIQGFHEPPAVFEREKVTVTFSRPFRDRAFSRQVREAYDNRCAITGLRLINGGGRPEIEAAHIRPVAENGPDAIQNGIALSRTAHWMFDRGLISIDDDMKILKTTNWELGEAEKLLNEGGALILPNDQLQNPHPSFLKFHRENVFKG